MPARHIENECWQNKIKFIVLYPFIAYVSCPNERVASAQSHNLELHALKNTTKHSRKNGLVVQKRPYNRLRISKYVMFYFWMLQVPVIKVPVLEVKVQVFASFIG